MGQFDQLETLANGITAKAGASPDASYTAQLIAQGVEKCAKKFGEEAIELALACVQGKTSNATAEAADVLYHLLVLLRSTGVSLDAVMAELQRREGTSGLVEKASRKNA
jgi:phosphoribosyl-ATP pyrophosphohydrolase